MKTPGKSRNIKYSIQKYLETQIAASDFSAFVVLTRFEDAYESVNAGKDIVVLDVDDTSPRRLQIGSNLLTRDWVVRLDVFATTSAQRTDFSDWLEDVIIEGCVYYETTIDDENGGVVATEIAAGRVEVNEITSSRNVPEDENGDVRDRNRRAISIEVHVTNS